jgi:hypothetical protein
MYHFETPFGNRLPFFSGKALGFASQPFNWFAIIVEVIPKKHPFVN